MRDKIFLTYVVTDVLPGLRRTSNHLCLEVQSRGCQNTHSQTCCARSTIDAMSLERSAFPSLTRSTLLYTNYRIAAVGNAVMVFITFLISVPAMIMPMTRGWLKFHGYTVVVCALFTWVIGLDIWFDTLTTRKNLSIVWNEQPAPTQSLLQQGVRPTVLHLA